MVAQWFHAKDDGRPLDGVPEAAEYLGVGMRTLSKFLDQGLIPAYKLGRVIRMKRVNVDAFLEAHRIVNVLARPLARCRTGTGACLGEVVTGPASASPSLGHGAADASVTDNSRSSDDAAALRPSATGRCCSVSPEIHRTVSPASDDPAAIAPQSPTDPRARSQSATEPARGA